MFGAAEESSIWVNLPHPIEASQNEQILFGAGRHR